MKKFTRIVSLGIFALVFLFGFVSLAGVAPIGEAIKIAEAQTGSSAAFYTACNFSRTLFLGSVGEDVRCLQRFLNSAGFRVAQNGLGAPSNETDTFGARTRDALIRWQSANGLAANGNFDQQSASFYLSLSNSNSIPNSNPSNSGDPFYNQSGNLSDSNKEEQRDALESINDARDVFDDAENEIEEARDGNENQNNIDDAEELLIEGIEELFDAYESIVNGDYDEARKRAEDAEDLFEDAMDEIDGGNNNNNNNDRDDARDAIDDAEEAIDNARDEIRDADDDGDNVDDAEDLLEEAEDALDEAWDAYNDEDYDDATDFAEEAEDLANDAIDEL